MRAPLDSPFSPGSDTVPEVWAGRAVQFGDWRDVLRPRRLAGIHERGRIILGEVGSGRSSLVRRIARDAADAGDWVTPQLRISSGTDPIQRVAAALLELAAAAGLAAAREQRISELLRRVEAVAGSAASPSVSALEGPEPYTVLTDLLIEIGRAAVQRRDVMVLIHIDEVQNITDEGARSQLLSVLGGALAHDEAVDIPRGVQVDRGLPIAVYLTGPSQLADVAGTRIGATFARHFRTITLDAIDDTALMAALQPFVTEGWPTAAADGIDPVFMEPAAQRAIVELSRGEPLLFQLAGERAWCAGTDKLITAAQVRTGWRDAAPEAEAHVQRILDRLTPRERQFLEAMADFAPEDRTLTNIACAVGYEKGTEAGPTAQHLDLTWRIIHRGRPYRFRHRAIEAYLTSDWPW
ncbi:ATP-binding protein [Actinomyces sp.]|uniref:ATP-binding protein n=1 Tax=Actinomyces sp. TaxID=29317 RepID=UPI0026DC3626|nr:ATP-binding protein [Actinomyces sp.]MDO4899309.1 ATP-binding protein [Actinomyces sp.]